MTARGTMLWEKYRLTQADYDEMLEAQDGGCKLCGATVSDKRGRPLHVDHCHRTFAIRGLLCARCNTLLGWVEKVGTHRIAEYLAEASPPPIRCEGCLCACAAIGGLDAYEDIQALLAEHPHLRVTQGETRVVTRNCDEVEGALP